MTQTIDMRASVTSILFGPAEDGYTMLSVRSEAGERVVAAGRAFPSNSQPGEELELTGTWKDSKRGPIFSVQSARKSLPKTQEGIATWLAKAKIPGIGTIKASRLVKEFGVDAIDALCNEHERAELIVGKKKLPRAAEAIRSRRLEAEIGATLSAHQIGIRLQKKIVDEYGPGTAKVLATDPFRMILDIDGVAFSTADKIARAAGLADDAPSRIRAAIVEVLRNASSQGHCALYHALLIETCRQMIHVTEQQVEAQLAGLTPKFIVETKIRGVRAWATRRVHRTEAELARHIARKLRDSGVPDFGRAAVQNAVEDAQQNLGLRLSEEQAAGAVMALTERLSILTGGPGTGKTHTLRVICEAWRLLAPRIRVRSDEQRGFKLGAPTGKAAKRITETTGFAGTTIHRMLEYKPEINAFERNEANPIETGLICIDEASMPDIFIANDLGRAWGSARVLLIGDTAQLPSVGPGKVLADMLSSGKVPHTRLTQIFRQAAGSEIALGADMIKQGHVPAVSAPGRGDLVHIEIGDVAEAAERVIQMYVDKMPAYAAKHGLDPASIQILTPGHGTDVGTIALNREIQRRLHGDNPKTLQILLSDKIPAGAGDKVIQLENDYERGIYNGDTGQIIEVEKDLAGETYRTHVDFGSAVHTFDGPTVSNLALAYALSIHKSQGSEYQIVIIPVTTSHYQLLRRTLLYTGTTRAKRLCVYVGTMRAIRTAVQREDSTTRITTLAEAIIRETEEEAPAEIEEAA